MALALLAPAAARAQSTEGGTAAPGGSLAPSGPVPAQSGPAPAPPGSPPVPAGGPNSLQAPSGGALVGSVVLVHGRLTARQAGRGVLLEMFNAGRWIAVGSARAGAGGGFVVAWRPARAGRFMLRASSSGKIASTAAVEVYRSVIASWFGPGSYGSRTACGQIMTPELVGVAHRTLPCGTMVDIVYANRKISVPVVDRGPFVAGVTFDLTSATAQGLGVSENVRIGAVAVPGGPMITR